MEFTRSFDRARAGDRGTVSSTGFFGDHDVTLEGGGQISGVPGDALRPAPGGGRSGGGDMGCAVLGLALLSAAATVASAAAGWWA